MVIFNSYVCLPDRTILIWWFDVPGTLGSANKIGRLGKQPLFLGVIQITSENMSCEDKPNMGTGDFFGHIWVRYSEW